MQVEPEGPGYEIQLSGEVTQMPAMIVYAPAVAPPSKEPLLLSNKHYLAWGGLTLGRAL